MNYRVQKTFKTKVIFNANFPIPKSLNYKTLVLLYGLKWSSLFYICLALKAKDKNATNKERSNWTLLL